MQELQDSASQLEEIAAAPVTRTRKLHRHHLLDPLSDRPYGPQLLAHEHDFSLGRSHYRTVKKTDDQIDIEVAPNTRVEPTPGTRLKGSFILLVMKSEMSTLS